MLVKNKYTSTLLPNVVMSRIVAKLKILRKKEKYTQQALAERADVSLGSIKRFERTGQISLESLLKIAQVLGRLEDFEDIFTYDTNIDIVKSKFE